MALPSVTIYSQHFDIDAPIDVVWDCLLDFEQYPEWNPFTVAVIGKKDIGAILDLQVNLTGKRIQISQETLQELAKPTQIAWGMHMLHPVLLKARRDQFLTVIDDNQCRYHTYDALSGLLSPLVNLLYGKAMQEGFDKVGAALQKRFAKV